jgi:hypothetical protein
MAPAATHSGAPDTMAQARAAIGDIVPSLVALIRGAPDTNTASVGTWTVGDVAAHISHTFRADTDALAGKPVPHAIVTKAGIAEATAKLLAEDSERDQAVLAVASPRSHTSSTTSRRVRRQPPSIGCRIFVCHLRRWHVTCSTNA